MKKMEKLGIWMDHSNAHILNPSIDLIEKKTITSRFTHQEKEHSISKSENLMHHKEQHQQHEYYKEIADVIKNYNEVIIFGPTDAKSELANFLKKDHHFDDIKIEVKNADKMTEHGEYAFVKEHFKI
jgi:stalled ribosome rescue protein Dom34